MKIQQIYEKLLTTFGTQGWWPTSRNGIPVHHGKAPKNNNERFEIIIGAILTQNTNWKNVEKALINLNKYNLINIKKIMNIDKNRLAKLIKPSGYYNQKAERLILAAEFFNKNIKKFMIKNNDKNHIDNLRNSLLNLKGIGPETADSILLYAFQKPIFVIDAYTRRIMGRNSIKVNDYHELQALFMNRFKNNKDKVSIYKQYHALLVKLGKDYCKPKPLCPKCPMSCKND